MKRIGIIIVFLLAFVVTLSSCSDSDLNDDVIGDINDEINDTLGGNSDVLKEALVSSVEEVLTQEGFMKCVEKLWEYDFSRVKDWDIEIGSVVDLYKLLNAVNSKDINIDSFINHYEYIRNNTVFVNDVLIKCSIKIIPSLPIIKDYYNESLEIKNWGKELDACVSTLEVLYKSDIRNLDDILNNPSSLNGEMMVALMGSDILKTVVVDKINNKIAEKDVISLEITKEDLDQIDTAEKWDKEIDVVFDALEIIENNNDLEYSEIVTLYNQIKETVLCKQIVYDAAPQLVKKLPVVKDYYEDDMVIENWETELDAIIASVDALDKANIKNLDDLLNEDSALNGEMMLTFTQSVILKNALVQELNKALAKANLEPNLIEVSDLDALNNKELWNAELSAMRNLITLKDNASTLEFDKIVEIYSEVRATSLCNKVLTESAPIMAKTLPVVSTYYDESVVIEDWTLELDSIVNTLNALSEANADGITNPLAENSPLNGKVLDNATKSIILTNAIVQELNNAVKLSGLAEDIVSEENIKLVNSEEAWNNELEYMRRLTTINFASTNMNTVIDIYKDIKENTILCEKILVNSASIIIPDLPIISTYYNDSLVIDNWEEELNDIINAYSLLVEKGLSNITEPIKTLDGDVIMACLESEILKAAFIIEFNNNLETLELNSFYQMNENEIAILDSPEKWNNELAAIQAVSDLAKAYSPTKVPAVITQVEATYIAKTILVSFLVSKGY